MDEKLNGLALTISVVFYGHYPRPFDSPEHFNCRCWIDLGFLDEGDKEEYGFEWKTNPFAKEREGA